MLKIPTWSEIESLAVGDLAPNAFGRMAEVVAITTKREDNNGNLFVCYTTRQSPTSTMTMSMKEGELIRHAGLRHTSAELGAIESAMRAGTYHPALDLTPVSA
jgi:hypothetical protein